MPLAHLVSPVESFERPTEEALPLDPRMADMQTGSPQAKERALESIMGEFAEPLTGFAASITGSSHVAEEVVQETFINAFTRADQFQGGSMRGWLYRITHNLAINSFRQERPGSRLSARRGATRSPDEEIIANIPSRMADPVQAMESKEAIAALAALPLNHGVVVLSSAFGFTAQETSQNLGVSVGEVKHRLSDGRPAARAALRAA